MGLEGRQLDVGRRVPARPCIGHGLRLGRTRRAPQQEFADTSSMDTFNLFRDQTIGDESDPPGFPAQSAQLAPRFGASRLGMTAYDLPPGQAICPYHFHWGDEEWLIVVSGSPSVRTPNGEQTLEPGDVVCFPVKVHRASAGWTRAVAILHE